MTSPPAVGLLQSKKVEFGTRLTRGWDPSGITSQQRCSQKLTSKELERGNHCRDGNIPTSTYILNKKLSPVIYKDIHRLKTNTSSTSTWLLLLFWLILQNQTGADGCQGFDEPLKASALLCLIEGKWNILFWNANYLTLSLLFSCFNGVIALEEGRWNSLLSSIPCAGAPTVSRTHVSLVSQEL